MWVEIRGEYDLEPLRRRAAAIGRRFGITTWNLEQIQKGVWSLASGGSELPMGAFLSRQCDLIGQAFSDDLKDDEVLNRVTNSQDPELTTFWETKNANSALI